MRPVSWLSVRCARGGADEVRAGGVVRAPESAPSSFWMTGLVTVARCAGVGTRVFSEATSRPRRPFIAVEEERLVLDDRDRPRYSRRCCV